MKAYSIVNAMSRIVGVIGSGLRVATASFRRRLLLAAVLALIVAIPSYAMIISNQTQHVVTIQDVTITSSPAVDSIQPSGSTEAGTVTVTTPQTFTGVLTLSITNTTLNAASMNPASFAVVIDSLPITGLSAPGVTTIPYVSGSTTIIPGYVFHYTVTFLSKAEDPINGIASGTTYQISQIVSE
jgi:hypothetical protein